MIDKVRHLYERATPQNMILFFTMLSLITAWRINYIQHGWVSNDFVLYHEAARLFSNGDWKQGFAVFGWPLYSLLIASVHQISGLDLHLSARVLSVIFFTITAYSFMQIIRLSGGDKNTIASGALIILSASYLTGDVLPMMARDPSLWAFFLTSLVFFIKYYRQKKPQDALLWQFFAILATLFRIEAITYVILLPFILLAYPDTKVKDKVLLFLKAQILNIGLLTLVLLSLLLVPSLSIKDFGRLQEVWGLFDHKYQVMLQTFIERSELMATVVLKNHFNEHAAFGLSIALVGMCIIKCANTFGWVNVVLLSLNLKSVKETMHGDTQRIFIFVIVLSIVNIFIILLSVFLLVGRYTAPLAFILMVFASFALTNAYKKASDSKLKWIYILVIIFMCLSLIKNLLSKLEGYNYQQDAVAWIKAHNTTNNAVFYYDKRLRYYANVPFINDSDDWNSLSNKIQSKSMDNYGYLVIKHSRKHPERRLYLKKQLPAYQEVASFNSVKSKNSIVIYQRN